MAEKSATMVEKPAPVAEKSTLRLYWELTRIRGFSRETDFTFWSAAIGILLAARNYEIEPRALAMTHLWFAIGSTILTAAICVLNDIFDRDLDGKVERTKNRPLVTGRIPVLHASLFSAALMAVPVYMLSYGNTTAFRWGLLGVFPLHFFYPLMKRVTYWPQAWLGMAINYSLIIAYLTVSKGQFDAHILVLYAGCIAWTIEYDTIYAYQDIRDDTIIGIKSAAILFGFKYGRMILSGFAALFWASLFITGAQNGQGMWFFIISVGGAGLHLVWQLVTWKMEDWDDCSSKFVSNGYLGALIWLGLLVDYCFKDAAASGFISKYFEAL
ncbi:hypothetical protein AAF712_015987 [Marasmius tenuissimus]|uniref:Uncharacterized protein n=1 Tax=Marasmius tenuissimus TaxID=585030 RepID=A0ABR2Z9D9_9AGAR|nr:hypothetical protein PM082_018577 [Marasmius tenuissimus]